MPLDRGATPTPLTAVERALAARLDGRPVGDAVPAVFAEQFDEALAAHAMLRSSAAPQKPGTWLGPYRLLEPLGCGGQGSVWLAEDQRLHRRVAVKVLDRMPADPAALLRFRREAAVAARLEHPGICSVFDVGTADGVAFIAMRYVAGPTLAQARIDRPPGIAWLEVVEKAARALHALHAAGVVHRDLKPGNIVLATGDQPVLLDFGLAQDVASDELLTRTGAVLGTPAYLAPERLSPSFGPVDARSDIWSLAATGFELVAGAPPFQASTREGLHHAILTQSPGHHLRRPPRLPRAVRLVFAVALSKRSRDRYATALDFAEDLRRARAGKPLSARASRPWFRIWRTAVHHRLLVGAVTAVVTALLLALAIALQSLATSNAALARADGLRQLAEAQLAVRRDPAAALAAAMAGAAVAPVPVVNDTLLAILPEVRQVWQQPGNAVAVAFGLGGSEVVAGDERGRLRSYALPSHAPQHARDLGARIGQLSLAADGRTLAAVIGEGTVVFVDAALQPLATLPQGTSPVTAVAAAGDAWLVGSRDGWLRVVEASGRVQWDQWVHRGAVVRVTASSDASVFASAGADGEVILSRRNGAGGSPRWHAQGAVHALHLDATGARLLAADADNTAHVFDTVSGRELLTLRGHESAVLAAAFAPDGSRIAIASYDRTLRLWNAADGALQGVLAGHQRPVRALAFAADGASLASAGDDDTVRVFTCAPPTPFAVLPHGTWATVAARFDAGGTRLVTTSAGATAKLWDTRTGALRREVDHGAPITCAIFDERRDRLLTAGRDGAIIAWQLADGSSTALLRLPPDDQVHLLLDHRGERLLVTTAGGQAWLCDAATGARQHALRGLAPLHRTGIAARCAFTGDDRFAVTVPDEANGSELAVTDAATGATVAACRGHSGMITSVDATAAAIASSSIDGSARLWQIDGTPRLVLQHPHSPVQQVRFDGAGARVLTSGNDCTARIFAAADGRELALLRGHDSMLYCGEFSPDGSRVITASFDGTAAIWDARSGERLVHQTAHGRPVFTAAFSPDGQIAVTTSLDGTARLWPVDPLQCARGLVR